MFLLGRFFVFGNDMREKVKYEHFVVYIEGTIFLQRHVFTCKERPLRYNLQIIEYAIARVYNYFQDFIILRCPIKDGMSEMRNIRQFV